MATLGAGSQGLAVDRADKGSAGECVWTAAVSDGVTDGK